MTTDLNALLLQALTASGSGGGLSTKELLMSQLGEGDPNTALLANLLMQQGDSPDADSDEADDRELPQQRRETERLQERMSRAIRQLRQEIDQIHQELEVLESRNDALAAALGACYLCWGEDEGCPVCRGRGRAGAFLPDRTLFVELVYPAVQRCRQHQTQVNAPSHKRVTPPTNPL